MTRREKLEIENKILRIALMKISNGYEFVTGAPFMNGTFEQIPKLISGIRMKEIAQEALEEAK